MSLYPSPAGVFEQAGCVSSRSLRAHAELLEQRLQAPPILRQHPLLSYRGRYEHGVKRENQRNMAKEKSRNAEEGNVSCVSASLLQQEHVKVPTQQRQMTRDEWFARFLYCYFFVWVDVAEKPLVRLIPH